MRGEYHIYVWVPANDAELPPRARRIPGVPENLSGGGGTTSACAENTYRIGVGGDDCVNYLRVRGEYSYSTLAASRNVELPPRARRIHLIAPIGDVDHGTTSACAENTRACSYSGPAKWNYLRVRGEYNLHAGVRLSSAELPPRARRIQPGCPQANHPNGTTSACAENTCYRGR